MTMRKGWDFNMNGKVRMIIKSFLDISDDEPWADRYDQYRGKIESDLLNLTDDEKILALDIMTELVYDVVPCEQERDSKWNKAMDQCDISLDMLFGHFGVSSEDVIDVDSVDLDVV